MKVGDVVQHLGKFWKVTGQNRDFGTYTFVNFAIERLEVPSDLDVTVMYSTKDWPFVAIPVKFKAGRIIKVSRRGVELIPLVDWVPSDMLRSGGSLFFSPELRLKNGEVLVAKHEKGKLSRVSITKAFGTGNQRKRRHAHPWKPTAPRTVYDRLTGPSLFDDEDL